MKVFVIMLALAIFSGSPTSVLSDEPVSRFDLLKQYFMNYSHNITTAFEPHEELIQKSTVYQELKDHAFESYNNISERFQNLELPKEITETLEAAFRVQTTIAGEVISIVHNFFQRLEPATRDLYNALEPVVYPQGEQVLETVRPYADVVRDRIEQMVQSRTENLKSQQEKLEALLPEIRKVLEQLREVRAALLPIADAAQDMIRQKVEAVVDTMRPYLSPVLDEAKKHAKGFYQ